MTPMRDRGRQRNQGSQSQVPHGDSVDAGIARALALDDELIVATNKPAAVQCIRWAPDSSGSQTSTELLSRMAWLDKNASVVDMIHDRPMNLSAWVTRDGKAYAVQRLLRTRCRTESRIPSSSEAMPSTVQKLASVSASRLQSMHASRYLPWVARTGRFTSTW